MHIFLKKCSKVGSFHLVLLLVIICILLSSVVFSSASMNQTLLHVTFSGSRSQQNITFAYFIITFDVFIADTFKA